MYSRGMSYSIDLRKRVIGYVEGGGSKAEAARIFGVSRGRIFAWLKLDQKTLSTAKRPGPVRGSKVDGEKLLALVKQRKDMTLVEMAEVFGVDQSTISYALKRLGISRKKNDNLRGSEVL